MTRLLCRKIALKVFEKLEKVKAEQLSAKLTNLKRWQHNFHFEHMAKRYRILEYMNMPKLTQKQSKAKHYSNLEKMWTLDRCPQKCSNLHKKPSMPTKWSSRKRMVLKTEVSAVL
jgi:hypothetical protein